MIGGRKSIHLIDIFRVRWTIERVLAFETSAYYEFKQKNSTKVRSEQTTRIQAIFRGEN